MKFTPALIWSRLKFRIDWVLLFATLPLLLAGLLTMNSFAGENYYFTRQLVWIGVSLAVCLGASLLDWRFLKRGGILTALFFIMCGALTALFLVGQVRGVQSWVQLGLFSVQPADFAKLLVIIILAKYFSRRHIEIANVRHIFVSGMYAFIPFALVFLQPDFGSAVIIAAIWLGMVMVSGVSKKHLGVVFGVAIVAFAILWTSVFAPYQKARIMTFLNPLADVRGAGYNANQAQIAVGSGQMWGKGVGFGTQSRLKFLPEYQTDFVFAAFAEEWGFGGVLLVFGLYGLVIWRILKNALHAPSNFEMLYCVGLSIYLMTHIIIHVGMNIGLLPVTGIPIPFMSYGGSHLVAEYLGLGILMGMRRFSRAAHRDDMRNEFLGI